MPSAYMDENRTDLFLACASLVFSFGVLATLVYLCWRGCNTLRLTCLISSLFLVPLLITAVVVIALGANRRVLVPLQSLGTMVFTTMLTAGLLAVGRNIRRGEWKTGLFKTTIAVLVLCDLVAIPEIVLRVKAPSFKPPFPIMLVYLILVVLVTLLAMSYAFFLVVTVHLDAKQRTQYYMPAHTAAVGTWYMLTTGSLVVINNVAMLVSMLKIQDSRWVGLSASIDVVLSSCITLSLALPQPKAAIMRLRRMIEGRRINHVVMLDRGVVTSGLVEGFYH